jgi:putative oxidoreductase
MNQTNASNPTNVFAFVGRLLIAALFILGGLGKLAAPEATQGYIASVGLPAPLLGLVIAVVVEAGGGLLLLIGYRARLVSLVLAAFTLILAAIFHKSFADQNQMIHFLKNVAIVGGLLQIAAFGAGSFSLDGRRLRA